MFNACEFVYNGVSSFQYGLKLYEFGGRGQEDVAFGNKVSIVETRTNNRLRPLHFGVNDHDSPLQFKIVFGSEEELSRYEIENIALWLTGHQEYCWLQIVQPDLERVQFRCLITEMTLLTSGWIPYAFEATVTCDCPYAYGFPFELPYIINGKTEILIRNDSTIRDYIKPVLSFIHMSGGTLSIVNHDDNDREFKLTGLPASSRVKIDNENGIIQETVDGINLYDGFNLNFFRLVHGDNNLTVTGNGSLTISGQYLYNVGA